MKRGDRRTLTIQGTPLDCEYLGRGHFCKGAWRNGEWVYLFVEGDVLKEAVEHHCQGIPHLPELFRLDDPDPHKDTMLYKMRYYPTVTAQDARAWRELRQLQAARAHAVTVCMKVPGFRWAVDAFKVNEGTIEHLSAGPLHDAAQALYEAISLYGAGCAFEFAPRNCGVGKDGALILRDCAFDAERMEQERRAKHPVYA